MSTHNICLHKEVKKKYTGYNLKTTEFLDCALIGVCAVIRSNTVIKFFPFTLRKEGVTSKNLEIELKVLVSYYFFLLFFRENMAFHVHLHLKVITEGLDGVCVLCVCVCGWGGGYQKSLIIKILAL